MTEITLGMVGGGQGAFIGAVHRIAARLDGRFRLVAGALSSDPDRAAASAAELRIERSYTDWAEMARAEAARPDGIRAVAIVTPNNLHFGPAKAFLEAGIHVICDKPMTVTLEEALELREIAAKSDALFILTHTYAGYPMLREARRLVAEGALGKLRMAQVEYVQDWLAEPVSGKQADWRADPKQAGTGAIGDIGTHAAHLARFVSGLPIEQVAAEMHTFVEGRVVDDNIHVMMRMGAGVRGMLWASQVAPGHDNDLRLRVIGEKATVDWCHDRAEELRFTRLGEAPQILTRGGPGFQGQARVPGGHPEGYLEAFASIYADAADAIEAGALPEGLPGVEEGVQGLRFIEACLASDADDGRWTALKD
ncbi:putative oxidoreductase YvaA [Pseudooceanicola marinus]|uniref:Putative oxidoreductase YvaA n=1 Tax=Pseudooceanicola marinus TaxID=396013 RepID=A0A1X6ZL41_9RHOB|nr:Gfo/Idh/MocA family oxidoreductase [Pseudooceanicola marinus]PJE31592.1 gfo/Idh/MocA family oxidoreductase [Pseudooceanicola marinus]SLN54297.1 putative oxidoreductase YvaA [Pseudooceanicola marinus]